MRAGRTARARSTAAGPRGPSRTIIGRWCGGGRRRARTRRRGRRSRRAGRRRPRGRCRAAGCAGSARGGRRAAPRPRQPQAPPDGSPPDPDAAHAGSTGHSAGRSSRNISPGRLIEPHTPLGAASTEMNDQHPSTGPSGNTSRASTAPSPRPSAPSPRQPAPPALAEEGEFSEVELQGHLTSAVRSQMLAKKRFSQAQPRNAYHVVNDADAGLMPEESGLLKVDGAPMRAGWGTPGSTEAGSNAHSEFGSQAPMSGLSANPLMTRLNMFANRANSLHDPSSRGDHSSQGTQRSTAAALPPRQPSGGLPVSFHAPVSPQSGALSDEEDGSLNDSISHGSLARASGGAQAEPAKKEGGHARTPSGASGRPSRPAHRGAQDSMQSIQSFSFEGGLGSEGNVASSADADSGPAPGPQWSGATSERLRAPAPAPAPAPAKGGPRKPPGLAVQGLHVEVGSQLAQGQWTDSGQWQEAPPPAAEPSLEMFASGVQRIPIEDLKKVKELGRGQFGSVWHERWRGVDVAVKEMHSVDPKSRAEMFREAVTLASLRHPCVVNFYGIVADNSIAATVLEYVRDGSLKAALCKLRQAGLFARWPPRRVDAFRVRCALGAARGMEYMHSQKVVHFDLKCDNLLCDLSNLDAPRVKISDVGLSKQKATTFISGNMRGTLPWMAPELFPGLAGPAVAPAGDAGLVNEKVDVYSFAVVMWEVWTLGQPPYSKLAMGAVLSGVIAGNLRPPVPQGCRPAWAALMQECWRPAPRARPGFPEICDRLEAMLEDVLREEEASRAGGE
ncbi:unnamed protein product [Pedinophyceae sp. YPF-701]|nr:unnamed protein product [Pedinophyceae sp. YPF-701]